jgi:hypothetical protein
MTTAIILCFVLTLLTIITINSFQSTKTACLMSLTQATDSAITAIEIDNQMNKNNYEEIVGNMLRDIILLSEGKGDINVKILEANTDEGLLDVQVTKIYKWFGLKREISIKRTVIMEEFEYEPQISVTAMFVYDEHFTYNNKDDLNIVREELTFKDAIIKRPKNPKMKGYTFMGWSLSPNGEIITNDEWQCFLVPSPDSEGVVYFYAVFEANNA